MRNLLFKTALLPDGWASDVLVRIDDTGLIIAAAPLGTTVAPPGVERVAGIAVPALANVHSHAHQRAIAGLGESSGDGTDSFWSWREAMYRALDKMDPEAFEAIAAQLYLEMVKAGYTSVAEFHYLHHDRDGSPYADPAEMCHRIVAAARTAGLGVTLLPVLYAASGFGGLPPTPGQKRFIHSAESFGHLMAALEDTYGDDPDIILGIAPHSLRAVPPSLLKEAVEAHGSGPIHIHIAEQLKEVEECLAHTGQRPVEWLLDHQRVDSRWCLIHATHLAPHEINGIVESRAVVGLCPTTEANLGDGIFPTETFLSHSGRIAIGSDSHISVSPVEELRWLEYAQRLITHRRAVLAGGPERSTARRLLDSARDGGAQARGTAPLRIAPGHKAEIVVLDDTHPLLLGRKGDAILDSWIFSGNASLVRHVIIGTATVIHDGRHPEEEMVLRRFKKALKSVLG